MTKRAERHCRYLVVGAGLAGATCAYLLKRAGEDVFLLERAKARGKSKLCAGLCTPRALELLHRIYGLEVEPLFRSRLTSVRCIADDIVANVSGITTKSLMRDELDAFALDKYLAAGGELVDELSIRNIDFSNGRVDGFKRGAGPFACEYEALIGADGALSQVRTALTGSAPDSILTLEAEVAHGGAPYTMAYHSGFFGYSWYAPVGTRAKIGCGAFKGDADLRAQLQAFAEFIGVSLGLVRGAYIPTGKDVLLQVGNVYLLGDAASLICPPSGEGIFFALHSALMLSRALRTKASYPALMQRVCAQIRREYLTRDVFFNKRFMSWGIAAADATPYGRERAVKFALKHFASFE